MYTDEELELALAHRIITAADVLVYKANVGSDELSDEIRFILDKVERRMIAFLQQLEKVGEIPPLPSLASAELDFTRRSFNQSGGT